MNKKILRKKIKITEMGDISICTRFISSDALGLQNSKSEFFQTTAIDFSKNPFEYHTLRCETYEESLEMHQKMMEEIEKKNERKRD